MSYESPNVVPHHIDGWSQVRTGYYRDLLAEQERLRSVNAQLLAALGEIVQLWSGPKEKAALSYVQLEKAKAAIALAESEPKP